MADSARESLQRLMTKLDEFQAQSVSASITTVIARGVTEDAQSISRSKELVQRPLSDDEAYRVSLEILIASIEPLVMNRAVVEELSVNLDRTSKLSWRNDFVEESPLAPQAVDEEKEDISEVEDLEKIENELKKLIELAQDFYDNT